MAFRLVPKDYELPELAHQYWETSSEKDRKEEIDAFDAGRAILNGDRTPEMLALIVHWKSPRVVHHLSANATKVIAEALDVAVHHSDTREAMRELQKLKGVAVPVASAILTTIHPDRYTIIDFRALEALGHFDPDVEFYIDYLQFCRTLSQSEMVKAQTNAPGPTKLRALDRALWEWSASKSEEEKKSLAHERKP